MQNANACCRCALEPGRRTTTPAGFSPQRTVSTTLQGGLLIMLRNTNNIQIHSQNVGSLHEDLRDKKTNVLIWLAWVKIFLHLLQLHQ